MNYRTEELIAGKIDVVDHRNIKEALDWKHSGIDVKLLRKDGEVWIESGSAELELMKY